MPPEPGWFKLIQLWLVGFGNLDTQSPTFAHAQGSAWGWWVEWFNANCFDLALDFTGAQPQGCVAPELMPSWHARGLDMARAAEPCV